MTNTNRNLTAAETLAAKTADAYSFRTFGARGWLASIQLLLERGYSEIEVEAIMRSKLTRWASDHVEGRRRVRSTDLASTMDHRMGGSVKLADYIAGCVAEMTAQAESDTFQAELTEWRNHDRGAKPQRALRLVWSR